MGDERLCATCHEVPLLGLGAVDAWQVGERPHSDVRAQDTIEEWRHSDAAAEGRSCRTCHMQNASHRFLGARDAAFVRSAFAVDAAVVDGVDGAMVQVHLSARDAGHAIPTGDPFRRLLVRVCADPSCERVLVHQTLGRWLSTTGADNIDTRIPVDGLRTLQLPLPLGPLLPGAVVDVSLRLAETGLESHLAREDVVVPLLQIPLEVPR